MIVTMLVRQLTGLRINILFKIQFNYFYGEIAFSKVSNTLLLSVQTMQEGASNGKAALGIGGSVAGVMS